MVSNLKSYDDFWGEYKEILKVVTAWAVDYEMKRDLSLINHVELLDVYNRIDDIQTNCICNKKMGAESELADYVRIWMWSLMVLRKNQIEGKWE